MSMVCPRCNTTFEERYHCPACGIPLIAYGSSGDGSDIYGHPKWQQTGWGRTVVGLLLAQGLYYGLWQLSTAAVLAMVNESARASWWSTATGGALLQVLLALSVVAGGMLAGAGQRRGLLYGAILGFINGLVFLAVPKDRPLSPLEQYGQPLLQAVYGLLGAWVGNMIWKPMMPIVPTTPPLGMTPPPVGQLDLKSGRPSAPIFAGPVNWGRVIVGTVVAMIGSSWANLILKWILQSDTGFSLDSQYHAKFVTWEISVLTLVLGAGLAGSNSRNGAKHGFLVGLAVAAGLLGIYHQSGGTNIPAPSLIFELMRIRLNFDPGIQNAIYTVAAIVPTALIGGWFGSQLLPPINRARRRQDRFPAMA